MTFDNSKTISDIIFHKISSQVNHIFVIPGDDPYLHIAIDKYCTPIIMRDEKAAAFAAQIYSRIKGLGVCATSHGPGMTNLVTGIAAAFLEHDKVLSISSQLSENFRTPFQHAYVSEDVLKPITKKVCLLQDKKETLQVIQNLISTARQSPEGPVALILPQDISASAFSENSFVSENAITEKKDTTNFEGINEAIELIEKSKKIITIIGAGVIRAGLVEELRQFLQKISALPFTTLQGKGVSGQEQEITISRHNLSSFTAELEYDLCLLIGVDKAESINAPKNSKLIISIGDKQNQIDGGIHIDGGLESILRHLHKFSEKDKWFDLQKLSQKPKHDVEIVAEMSSNFDGTICIDTGLYKHAWATFCKCHEPLKAIFTNGLSSIGWSIGAAIGAYYATGKPSLAIIGDGGFSMSLSELYPIMQYDIPVSILVINDNSYGMIKRLENERTGKSSSLVEIKSCNLAMIAQAFEFEYLKISKANMQNCFSQSNKRKLYELSVNYSNYQFTHH